MTDFDPKSYDEWFESPWGSYAFAIETSLILDALDPRPGDLVLDAGCGTGRLGAEIRRRDAVVIGADRDPAMAQLARSRMPGRVVVADALALPFATGVFDSSVAFTLCEFTGKPELVIGELARVTKTGGRLVLGALNPKSPWGVAHRKRFRSHPWNEATFYHRGELAAICTKRGQVTTSGGLYSPALPLPRPVSMCVEATGSKLAPQFGAFQIIGTDLS